MDLRDASAVSGAAELVADAVIVGSGPGGAAAARVLAEAGLAVVVVEEGPARSRFRPNYAHTARYHMQEAGAMIARAGLVFMPIAAGRGVGGGSLVNSALCFRTPAPILSDWVELLGDERYGPAPMTELYDELEEILGVVRTGEHIAGENNLLLVRGARALGLHADLAPRNAPDCLGCGLCNTGCPVGGKASVDRNLIPMALGRGAIVQADSKVDRILVEGGRAAGVVATVRDADSRVEVGQLTVRAPRVLVCCGGVGTPRLLHRARLAKQLGPAVGRGLHIHPGSAVLGVCDHEVHMWRGATQGAYFEDPELPGTLPHTFAAPPGPMMLILSEVGHAVKESLALLPHLTGCLVMISDKGEGTVSARRDGRARVRYRWAPRDLQRTKDGMVKTARVLQAGGARRFLAPVHGVGMADSPEDLQARLAPRKLQDFTLYASHPMASCRMGTDPATAVIGPSGEAHRLPGLYLADSSIFPTSLGVNPQLTTMAIATLIARGVAA